MSSASSVVVRWKAHASKNIGFSGFEENNHCMSDDSGVLKFENHMVHKSRNNVDTVGRWVIHDGSPTLDSLVEPTAGTFEICVSARSICHGNLSSQLQSSWTFHAVLFLLVKDVPWLSTDHFHICAINAEAGTSNAPGLFPRRPSPPH